MSEKKYIHISKDEKFINSAIIQFEAVAKGQNIFYILVDNKDHDFKHVSVHPIVVKITKDELINFEKKVKTDSIVFFHSIFPAVYSLILSFDKKIKIIWFCFGFEVYNDPYFFDDKLSLGYKTYTLFGRKPITNREFFSTYIKSKLRFLFKNLPISLYEQKKQVFKRINFIGSPFKEEFDKVKCLIKFKGNYFEFSYYPLEIIIDIDNVKEVVRKNKILIGNSAFYTSNHVEVFETLANNDLTTYQIITPLNYGKNAYVNFLIKKGYELFGRDKFNPLTDFIDINKYNDILNEVDFAFLNNRRQQAVGNTLALIYLGANVVLNTDNPIYSFFKRIGVKVHKFEKNLDLTKIKKLTETEIYSNRTILLNYFSKNTLETSLRDQLKRIK